jgi:hypothetical protein
MRSVLALAVVFALAGVPFRSVPEAAAAVPALTSHTAKPDLGVWVSSSYLGDAYTQKKNEVRFSTTIFNVGTYPLKITRVPNGNGYDAFQEFVQDGVTVSENTGTMFFHKRHQHYHFDDFALYQILGPVAAGDENSSNLNYPEAKKGVKASFCMIDLVKHSSPPGSPANPVFTSCSALTQGISIGWADVYGSHLDGQSISLSGLANAYYRLVVTANPLGKIRELDTTNNVGFVTIRVVNGRVTQVILP